jgi:selenide,water dikinase
LREALDSMKTLNRLASEIMTRQGVLSATDITGFGCLGHALRMAEASGVTLEIHARALPVFEGVDALLAEGCVPGAAFRNLSFVEKDVSFDPALSWERRMLLCDAQTSGGLFFCVAPDRVEETLRLLREAGITAACEVGVVRPPSATKVAVTFS